MELGDRQGKVAREKARFGGKVVGFVMWGK